MEITDPLKHTAHEIEERVRPQIEESARKLTNLRDKVATYIRTNPGRCLLGAVAAGYIVGRVARRK